MSGVVYILCAATSLLCAGLLLRSYAKNRVRLLFWSGLCFLGLGIDNVIMYIDVILLPTQVDFSLWRKIAGLVALMALLYGLIWDSK
jgi:hypothetical protein